MLYEVSHMFNISQCLSLGSSVREHCENVLGTMVSKVILNTVAQVELKQKGVNWKNITKTFKRVGSKLIHIICTFSVKEWNYQDLLKWEVVFWLYFYKN